MASSVRQFSGVAGAADCARWLANTDAALEAAADAALAGPTAPQRAGAAGPPAWPCSLRLATLPGLFDEVCAAVHRHRPLRAAIGTALGPHIALLADHCWVRHQPAPGSRLPGQTPHSWHQDGALAFAFDVASPPYPADALLPMVTCWLPLTHCGGDAPSLAWFEPPLDHLLAPGDLLEDVVAERFAGPPAGSPARHAVLAPGDALLFGGGILHRTHATPAMTRHRTSVELRWLPADAVPPRLAGGRILDASRWLDQTEEPGKTLPRHGP